MANFNPYQAPAEPVVTASAAAPADPALSGLRGWLILVGILTVWSPIVMLFGISIMAEAYMKMSWAMLSSGPAAPFAAADAAFKVLSWLASVYLVYLFFAKKKAFPTWCIWVHVAALAFPVIDSLAMQLVRPDLPIFDAERSRQIGRLRVSVCIWVPYMIMSKRVRATFTR